MTVVRNDVAATYCQGDGGGSSGNTFTDVTLLGPVTIGNSFLTQVNNVVTNIINTGDYYNLVSIAADTTFTFSATPAAPVSWFGLSVRNTDTNPHILTFPSSFSQVTQALRTTCPIAASGELWLLWAWDGAEYQIFGDSPYFNRYNATVAPAITDDVADGYGPGSFWYNSTTSTLYINKSNAAGAASWGAVGGGVVITPPSGSFIISGGGVSYNAGGLSMDVAAAVYQIQGTVYTSPLVTLTAAAANVTNPRFDAVVLTTSSVAALVTGTPAASPVRPDIDPTTQLQDTFFLVAANATTLAVTVEDIYHENTEWTTSRTGTTFNLASTNNPYSGTVDIEGTLAISGNSFRFLKPAAGTFNLAEIDTLTFYVRSKATWAATRFLSISVGVGNTPFGQALAFGEGSFGFNSSLTGVYQLIVIPTSLFNANGLALTRLWFTVAGSGAGIGAYFDDFEFQTGLGAEEQNTRFMHWRGNYLAGAFYNINDVVLSASIQYVAIQPGSGNTPATSPTFWQPSSAAGGSGTLTNLTASNGVETASGAAITATGAIRGTFVINAQTGTTYALVAGDRGKHVTLSNAASIAVSIAQAGTSTFTDGWFSIVENIGIGAATITPATSTINGAATLVLDGGMSAILFSDGTNYRAMLFDAAGVGVNAQTGTTYTYLSGDRRKLVTHTNGSAIAGTLPQAIGAFGANWFMWVENRGAGTLTITPATSTIDGAATLALLTNQGCLIASDGTNYFSMRGLAGGNAFGTVTVAGQSDIVADQTNDTLTIVAGSGITLTTDASTDTLTITNNGASPTFAYLGLALDMFNLPVFM